MLRYDIDTLDIKKIADSGQTFRMRPVEEGYFCIAGDRYCITGGGLIDCPDSDNGFWNDYFDLDTDYNAFNAAIDPDDAYLCEAADYGKGIRILRQDPWEMLITFIISQRRSIPSIKTCTEALCSKFGAAEDFSQGTFMSFPAPEALAAASLDELSSCGLGYRTEYVSLAARSVSDGSMDLNSLKKMDDAQLLQALMSLRGVGPKVANCISLFGYHRIAAFPIDVWIDRVLKEHYPEGFPFERYDGFAGVMQQYMFYAARKQI